MGNIVVFGRTLDPLFGKTATDFHRFVHFIRIHVFPNFVELSNELLHQVKWSGLAQLVAHQTLGRGVHGLILVRGIVSCGHEQVTFPRLSMYICIIFLSKLQ